MVSLQESDDAPPSRLKLGLWVALFALAADQLHKFWMIEIYRIADRGRVMITPNFDLLITINPGVSYGLFAQDRGFGQYLLAGFALAISLLLVIWMRRTHFRLVAVSLGLILGGALGNALDRFIRGGVADFFSFHFNGFYWYIFNVADVWITLGVAGLVLDALGWFKPRPVSAP